MKGRKFKDVLVQPGTKMWEFLDKKDQKSAEKLLKCINPLGHQHL